tara:strand:- start:134208 stop:135206 length:999 start_codon:yes stop_codon:yes gene_type:complete
LSNLIKFLLKLALAIGIIYWLIQSGKLDFSLVSKSISSGPQWIFCLLLIFAQAALSSVRWKLILEINSDKIFSSLKVMKVTWIGLFFNSFLPGAVTGDFIKLLYVKDIDPKMTKTYLVTTVLIDRILGLIGLLTILGMSSMFFYEEIIAFGPKMATLLHFNLLLFAGAMFFISLLFAPQKIQNTVLNLVKMIPVLGEKIEQTLSGVWLIGAQKKTLLTCLGISIILQGITIVAFYIISSPFYGKDVPLTFIASLVPSGFIAIAIPISPAGLGVGHYIFDLLFSYIHIQGGANFFNLFFLVNVTINSLGFFPYVFSGKKHTLEEAEQFEEATL